MTNRSRQAAKLAQLLSERTGRSVRAVHDGPKQGRYGGWVLDWVDGPTLDTMRALLTEYADQFPDLPPLGEFRLSRSRTDESEAVAMLLWLDAEPDRASTYAPTFLFGMAHDATDDPDQAPEIWQRRGRTLRNLVDQAYSNASPTGYAPSGHTVVAEQIIEQIHTGGWESVLAWLDHAEQGPRYRHLRAVD
ncbi:hypothetical protein [Nocardia sp. CDC160]|uniref:hypothetical protein n=1 Tax=Nocardia sp. CDC160 TaxID=3112166 RepID=UPI002DBE17F7|nr:hypothetical protein [Nocardia sp. CDC160]MEC3920287.1 hypothetical protein [Nocardia sp. CDC160]